MSLVTLYMEIITAKRVAGVADYAIPTPEQWVQTFLGVSHEARVFLAELMLTKAEIADECLVQNHKGRLEDVFARTD